MESEKARASFSAYPSCISIKRPYPVFMKRLQAFKFELIPSGEHTRLMRQFTGCRRVVFNKGLARQREAYALTGKKLSYASLCKELTQWKNDLSLAWLGNAPAQALQQALKDLDQAYANFFSKRAAFPTFKKKGQGDSFRYPQSCKLDQANSRIFLPKLGWIRYRNSREVLGEIGNVTISEHCGKWFVSIQTEREVEQPLHPATSSIGIDLGIINALALSDGSFIAGPNCFRQHRHKLGKLQRQLARKKKFSSNWRKHKQKISRLHAHIAHIRRDFLHQTTAMLSKNHAFVAMEDLKVRNMSKSAAGTKESPGKHVKTKAGLNRSILDQGWAEFRRQLEYKQEWRGGMVVAVPPHHTSQRCSCCGHVDPNNRKTQDRFACTACGYATNADLNAARNILAAGHAVLACGEPVQQGRSVKQEPTEATRHEPIHA